MSPATGTSFGIRLLLLASLLHRGAVFAQFAEIQVIDEATGRGVPLVELTTVNQIRYVTDNAGRVAFLEPGLMAQPVFFKLLSHGYEFPKDPFGYSGTAIKPVAGQTNVLKIKRLNIAERLHRITGEGLYRDSVLLGHSTPLKEPLGPGRVVGQDSAFAVPYQNKIFWFWGDTLKIAYPLGHFWMAGATSQLPAKGGLDPAVGIDLDYFVDETGFSRPMCRLGVTNGLIWADAFTTVTDATGREHLVCHYAHMESLFKILGHGLAAYNDDTQEFDRIASFDLKELWRWPAQSHPIHHSMNGTNHLLFGDVYPTVRVPATLEAFADLNQYEAWTCLTENSTAEKPVIDRDESGALRWSWRRNGVPVDSALERELIAAGQMKPEEARGQPVDATTGEAVELHRGSVNWNPHRERWIMIVCQKGGTSPLGEIWYAESADPTGPWAKAVKVLTHDRYSFYNPVHHSFFDQENGRLIYFEGTYVNTFSGNPDATPRYDYNQIQYRLDLDDPRLKAVQAP